MIHRNHREYYVVRAEAARKMAEGAASPGIAAIHAQMASCYDSLAQEMSDEMTRMEIRPRTHG